MKLSAARRFGSAALVIALAGVTALTLVACVQSPKPRHSSAPLPSSSSLPTESSSPSATALPPTPSVTPSVPAGGKPVTVGCDALISAQTIYDFNPNFGLDTTFTPRSGTAAQTAVADSGIACNWLNQTSGDTITFSVARPGASAIARLKTAAAAGTPVSGYGDAAYFATAAGAGRIDVFSGEYWLVGTSVYFTTAADAQQLVTAALSALH